MWDLNDEALYFRFLKVRIPHAFTWGDKDREKRETIRKAVATTFPSAVPKARWWAFRLYAWKSGTHGYDIENIPKLIIDVFARKQIQRDNSEYPQLAIYEDDKVEAVGLIQVAGETCADEDATLIEIYGRKL